MRLHLYFARRFALTFGGVFAVFMLMVALVDLLEQLGGFSGSEVGFRAILGLSLLSIPEAMYRILPLILILSTIALFLNLARTSEMVVTRAAGRSALRALVSPVLVTLLIGGVSVALINPIVAATSKEYERRAGDMRGQSNVLNISSDGLWLRQGGSDGQSVIRAQGTNLDGTMLTDVTIINFTFEAGPVRRIEAASAQLVEDAWLLTDAKVWPLAGVTNPEANAETHASLRVGSTLTPDQIRDSFGAPSSISIWELPRFIQRLETAGFAARRHQVWFQSELAQPALLIAMLLIGAGFTMRHQRGGRTGLMVLTAIILSFSLYFLRNFAMVLGENGQLPVLLAAWAPPLAGIGLSLGVLLHLEDG